MADHDAASRREILNALRSHDCDVFESADYPSASQVLERVTPDIAIVEESLQGTTGVPWLKWLDSYDSFSETRIIALTEDRRSRTKVKALGAGADAVLTKPVNAEELTAVIDSLLRRWGPQIQEQAQMPLGLLEEAYAALTNGWVRALDLRDIDSEGHSRRVAALTVDLATYMGVPSDRIEPMRRGALLHDIGKIGVPDKILRKEGELTQEERQEMQRHTEYARALLSDLEQLSSLIEIPYSHHERWDGTGYPQGLSGESIPIAARIFAVVDVYDALRSERPYKLGWSETEALSALSDGSGTQFDPSVVDAFLEMLSTSAVSAA